MKDVLGSFSYVARYHGVVLLLYRVPNSDVGVLHVWRQPWRLPQEVIAIVANNPNHDSIGVALKAENWKWISLWKLR